MVAISGMARVVEGRVTDADNDPVGDVTVIFSVNDSIVGMQYTDAKGTVTFDCGSEGALDVTVQAAGFADVTAEVGADELQFTVRLSEASSDVKLGEVTVEADMSGTVKRLANGNRFYLSRKAAAMKDPFMALKEIPVLESDPFNATLKTIGGVTPLILINGVEVNSGIKPIDPKDIESVEVIDAVPARYLVRGIKAIVNIRLRPHRAPYVWTELATRHEMPLRDGFAVGYFEVGNEKLSLYGRASGNYTHHDDSRGEVGRENTGYSQQYGWDKRRDGYYWLGELLFKYIPTASDYLAVQVYEKYDGTKAKTLGNGTYTAGAEMPFVLTSADRERSSVFTSSVYYKHTFSKSANLEVIGSYNNNINTLHTLGSERFGDDLRETDSQFDNRRNSGHLDIHFTLDLPNGNSLTAGSFTRFKSDRIRLKPDPVFRHHNYDEYVYAAFTGAAGKFYYLVSAGLQATWLKAGHNSNRYLRPRYVGSATFQANRHNSVQLYYTMSNDAPDASALNPYNTSTDSLVVQRGNPYLVPQIMRNLNLSYTFNTGGLYTTLTTGGHLNTDLVTPSGYTDPEGVYTSTYANAGKYRQLFANFAFSYRFSGDKINARVNGHAGWARKFYEGFTPKNQFSYGGGVNAWFGKFYFGLNIDFNPKDYADISYTRNLGATSAFTQLNYSITENCYIAVALQGFTGDRRTRQYINNGTFRSVAFTRYSESGFRPWVLLRWNMRKNIKRKINLDKVLDNHEEGIRLKKQ